MTPELLTLLKRDLDATPHKERGLRISQAGQAWGVSRATLYRALRTVGWSSGRAPRGDRGDSVLSVHALRLCAAVLYESQRQRGQQLTCIKQAVEMLAAAGDISPELAQLSPSTWARELRRHGLSGQHMRQPTLALELDSRHPNEWHEVDASIGVLFYLDRGRMRFRQLDLMDPKNKPELYAKTVSSRLLLIRWVLVDHYSGSTVVDYQESTGETSVGLVDFLHYAWTDKGDKRFPFHGVPRHLYADQGSPQKSAMMASLCEALDVNLILHQSAHTRADAAAARATGAVEAANRVWEREFESKWRFEPPTGGLTQIRAQARDFCIALNSQPSRPRRSTELTRSQLWMDILDEQLRLPPAELADFRSLAVPRAKPRKLEEHGYVRWQGDLYQVQQCAWYPGEPVEVTPLPYEPGRLSVFCPRTNETLPALKLSIRRTGRTSAAKYLGERDSQPETRPLPHHAAALRVEMGADRQEGKRLQLPTDLGRAADAVVVSFPPRQGTPIVPRLSGRQVDAIDVCLMATDRLQRRLEQGERLQLEAHFEGKTKVDELVALEWIEALCEKQGQPRQVLTLAGRR